MSSDGASAPDDVERLAVVLAGTGEVDPEVARRLSALGPALDLDPQGRKRLLTALGEEKTR